MSLSKIFASITCFMALSVMGFSQQFATDLIISEYHEGGSNHKWLEIYNGTGAPVDLSDYSILYEANNSSDNPPTHGQELTLSGTLAHNTTYVIANPSADGSVQRDNDWPTFVPTGDDPIALAKNGTIIDAIGYPYTSTDPENGSSFHWPVAGVILDEILIIRKPDVYSPNADWAISGGTDATSSEWIVVRQNVDGFGGGFDDAEVGQHTMNLGTVPAGPSGVFFSEYFESDDGRYLEIFNATDNQVDLSDYYIAISSDGNDVAWADAGVLSIQLNGTLDAKGIATIAENNTDILTNPTITDVNLIFDGNDAVALFDEDPANGNDPIDVLGTIGNSGDPDDANGSEFYIYDDTRHDSDPSTEDFTLIRKPSVSIGSSSWTIADNTGIDESNSSWLDNGFSEKGTDIYNSANAGLHFYDGVLYPTTEEMIIFESWSDTPLGTDFTPWSAIDVQSAENWEVRSEGQDDSRIVAGISNFGSRNASAADDWLISSRIDNRRIQNTTLDFSSGWAFTGSSTLSLMISTDYIEGTNPLQSTWIEESVLLDNNNPSAFTFEGFNFDLSAYNSDNLYIAFRYYDGLDGSAATTRVDNIKIYGTKVADVAPTQLGITRTIPSEPVRNLNFEIIVEAQDANGVPMPVSGNVDFTLAVDTGNGVLSNVTGTILDGEMSTVVTTTYDNVEVIDISVTDDAGNLTQGVLNNINVIDGPASLDFIQNYGKAYVGVNYPEIILNAFDSDSNLDTDFSGISVEMQLLDAVNNVSQSFTANINGGIVTYSNLRFDNSGTFTLRANANGLISNDETVVVLPLPTFDGLVIPQYVIGNENGQVNERLVPSWALVEVTGMHPNTVHTNINSMSNQDNFGNQTAIQSQSTRGNNIFYNGITDNFFQAGPFPSFVDNNVNGCEDDINIFAARYSTFVSDENGEAQIWISHIPNTSNQMQVNGNNPIQQLWWVFELGTEKLFGGNPQRIQRYQAEDYSIPVVLGEATSSTYTATGVVDYSSELDPRSIVSVWSGDAPDGLSRPVSTAMVQDEGTFWQRKEVNTTNCDASEFYPHTAVTFYQEVDGYNVVDLSGGNNYGPVTETFPGIDGGWASFIPNFFTDPGTTSNDPANIKQITVWDFETKQVTNQITDNDGIWGSVNTNAPEGTVNLDGNNNPVYVPIVFNTPSLEFTSFQTPDDYCNDGSDVISWKAPGLSNVTINVLINGVFADEIFASIPAVDNPARDHETGSIDWDILRGDYSEELISLEIVSNDVTPTLRDTTAEFILYDVPQILANSQSQIVCPEETVTLGVSANGSSVQYQWLKDGEIMDGETSSQLTLANVNHQASAVYSVSIYNQASNVCGTFTSEDIVIYVTRATEILTEPKSVGALEGGSAFFSFEAHANGLPQFDYIPQVQWYRGTEMLENNERYSGVKSNLLKINNIMVEDFSVDADYHAVISAECNSATTTRVSLLDANINVLEQPTSQEICEGTDVILPFIIEDADSREVNYSWYRDGIILQDGSKYSGTNSATLTILAANESNEGQFYCGAFLVAESFEAQSDLVMVTVNQAPVITTNTPAVLDFKAGNAINLEVVVETNNSTTYQWFKDGEEIDGATENTLIVPAAGRSDAGEYYCQITNDCGTINSTTTVATLDISSNPTSVVDRTESGFALYSPVPNPVAGLVSINFDMPKPSAVTIKLVSQVGQELLLTANQMFGTGSQEFNFNVNELSITNGVYVITFESGDAYLSQTIVIAK